MPNPFPQLLHKSGLTVTALAQRIGAPANTVSRWASGQNRPRTLADIRRLAECFNLSLDEGFALFWDERLGDPCVHDWCGGVKILPTDDKAQGLDVMIKCPDCGKEREFRGMQRYRRHSKFCGHCNRIRLGAGLVTLKCVDCGTEKTVRRSDL